MQTGVVMYLRTYTAGIIVDIVYYDCGEDGVASLLAGPYNDYFYKDGGNLDYLPKIYDENGQLCDFYYEFIGGALQINQRTIKITVTDVERGYNAEALTSDRYSVENLINGHTISNIEFTGWIVDIGSTDNNVILDSVVILDANGNDVTRWYDITAISGRLTIT